MPSVLFLIFETGGFVYAFETLEQAGDSVESMDLVDGHYLGSYSDEGEVITMSPGPLWANFELSETFDPDALATLIRSSRVHSELADRPHEFALAVWQDN